MRILITGSNGLLGQKLTRNFLTHGHDLIGLDLHDSPYISDAPYRYIQQDMTFRKAALETIRRVEPDVIIHTAAMTGVDRCELERETCWKINVEATDTVVTGAVKTGARVVFISTDYVFDGSAGPYSESDSPNPINYYGRSKLAAENLVRGGGAPHIIFRTIVLYGAAINANACFLTWLLGKLRLNRQVFIVTDQWGNATLADDLASAVERGVLLGREGLFHVGGRDYLTRFEFAVRVARFFGLDESLIQPITTDKLQQPAKRPLRSGLEIDYAERELFISFQTLEESFRIYQEQEKLVKSES
ncbi:MAG: SDR family oxidoreductase [Calditrichota bacterium]